MASRRPLLRGTSVHMKIATAVIVSLALVPAVLYWINVWLYRRPRRLATGRPAVSVLLPARNEEREIAACIEAILASREIEIEMLVLDDHSDDRTSQIVAEIAQKDARVRLIASERLPDGWCGKQFACVQLARVARSDLLVFLDADVRVAPDGISRLVRFCMATGADLVSGVPRQITGTLLERLLIPLIHFVLL